MSTAIMSVRLPAEVKSRLDELSVKTGRPSSFYVRRAVEEYLDDLEDAYAADHAFREWQADGFRTRDWAELKTELGL
ncbi:MAG: ribbon-helix-helix protein, CopG family [Bifidobacteriaceae bacterium]|jgi:RHH-type rel operon transcriptional repressor/antitoxin RelB|nr:ribbon-helix-helix protein, CopG family [Bifidobacteriaceae bacterium]